MTPRFNEGGKSVSSPNPISLTHSVPITNGHNGYSSNTLEIPLSKSRDVSKEREKSSMDFTDIEGTYEDIIDLKSNFCFK